MIYVLKGLKPIMKTKAQIFRAVALISLISLCLLTGSSNAQKFAYVDTKYILDNISAYKSAQEQLDKLSVEWQQEIETKYAQIDKLYKAFQAEQILLTEEMKRKRQEEIVRKERDAKDLQKKRFGVGGDIHKKRQELIKPIQDKIYEVIKEIATNGNYGVIFDKAGTATMLYTDPKYDKSEMVLNKLGYKARTKPKSSKTDKPKTSETDQPKTIEK
jgi:outer membrane protein